MLIVGEMDFSFSLAVALLRTPGSKLVATSYQEAFDMTEDQEIPVGDIERLDYERRSLPAMDGDLKANLKSLRELRIPVAHGVDATDLAGTLPEALRDQRFKYVVFPFPNVSLARGYDPRNSKLLLDFFRCAEPGGRFVTPSGSVQLVMLSSSYEEWDVPGLAASAGLVLQSRVKLPASFYQLRDGSGRACKPQGQAELVSFCAAYTPDAWGREAKVNADLSLAMRERGESDVSVEWQAMSIPVVSRKNTRNPRWVSKSPRRRQERFKTTDTFKPVSP